MSVKFIRKVTISLVIAIVFHVHLFAQKEAKTVDGKTVYLYDNGTWLYADSVLKPKARLNPIITGLEIPKTNSTDEILSHVGYSFVYNEEHEQSNWVAYHLTKEKAVKLFERTNKFVPDPLVKTLTANNKDYEASGYDKGHLAPAADMSWSKQTMEESFYFSNMSPQLPAFNRGIWKKLEELVRAWVFTDSSLYIVTGPVLTKGLKTIGANQVSVPKYYYKVILKYTEHNIKAIAFLFPNESSDKQLQIYAVPIDGLEKLTGIDFFPLLDDKIEDAIEKDVCLDCWSWKEEKTNIKK